MIVGRFAPTPSGGLHMGSLVAALASRLAVPPDGHWLLRIDDIDTPRVVPGSADRIIRQLTAFGFEWQGEITWQSQRFSSYERALRQLRDEGLLYACACSRKTLTGIAEIGAHGPIYPGICTDKNLDETNNALRIRVADQRICFDDQCRGRICENLRQDVGDFVVKRRDNIFAYHLATVVDDADAGVTQVVRGADLLDATCRQIWLQQKLNLATPTYAHIAIINNAQGQKLSKQNLARELDENTPLPLLLDAWRLLGQTPFAEAPVSLDEFWAMARAGFDLSLATTEQQQYE